MAVSQKISEKADRWQPPGRQLVERHGTARDWIEAGTHYRMEGSGPAVILIHEVGLDLTLWAPQVQALSRQYTVIRYDMLGHGQSAKPPGQRTIRDYMVQLENLHRYLQLNQVAVIGFSMGGLVARAFAQAHPDKVAKLVILSSVFKRSDAQREGVRGRYRQAVEDGHRSLIDATIDRWFPPEYAAANQELVGAVRARLESNDSKGFLEAYRLFADADLNMPGAVSDISCPTLVTTGELDPGSSPDMSTRMAAAIPGAICRILPGLGHMAPVEGAGQVNEMLLEFLSG